MAAQWKHFKTAMKDKRTGKRKAPHDILQKEEIVIQRLSAEVSGKAQKYSRVGPREFVPFDFDEVTLENIKSACKRHFAPVVGGRMVCDVLAGEQGPSCSSIQQIPDLKVVHVRFIEETDRTPASSMTASRVTERSNDRQKRPCGRATAQSLPVTKVPSPSKAFPKSLSVLEMMKLGKVVNEKTIDSIELLTFDLAGMAWNQPTVVEFSIAKESFGKGGFREAFRATSKTAGFRDQQWVIKRYLESAVNVIRETKQTLEQHTKKVVQMHMLARNFTKKLEQELKSEDNLELYGKTLTYNKIYMGRINKQTDHEWVTVEEYIDGDFTKYLNNTGVPCGVNSEIRQKCESLAHYSYERSGRNLMVVDMQGSDHTLFDPEIASKELLDGGEVLFSTGNLSVRAISNFIENHTECNLFCNLLGLEKFPEKND